ncbi:cell division protein ZipA [Marinomonas mediterranea]|jgi:cell division protein ZipA|uniref:Cell division protein ZipA n=1 Tax=Marinomonas mediterranea (strain ATCC 700492 / JCM 21426 / NBRC 103028 / MMB-1) TaxID=717774 RepID=F2K324_MARM1|nr:cell division protein ZipA [Marinomonas mediterranea]ADZ92413.1 Cell division protein zipA-like protein [Marinomonas mediterranea MMB-1]WCN10364.1 cell division protein ZipA [Marinomonas mediterranea]WCN14410.1 cell division protein ZipA [Marinomonas mediterranea]WCN18462.1 cell division protein ZipA [Marinomonas mediterranea MMB-1]
MDFSLREWLILVGVVIIIVILVDGYRRYRKNQLALNSSEYEDDDEFVDPERALKEAVMKRELPNGGARPVSSSREAPDPIANAFENARKTSSAPLTEMPHKVDAGPQIERDDDIRLDELESLVPERFDASEATSADQDYSEPAPQSIDEDYDDVLLDPTSELTEDRYDDDVNDPEDYERNYSSVDVDQVTPQGELEEHDEHDDEAEIEEVIVINVFAPEDNPFAGMELLQLVINCGMRYGEMDIFHRHEEGFDRGRVQFSMANAIEPGTFDLDSMGETTSPGVSFFMGLPGPKNSMKAFDFMLETSQTLVRNLGGELRDDRRSPMSEQTIAHCRQRIRDFERRKLTRQKNT